MTQTVKIQTQENKDVSFILRDDGRVFCESVSLQQNTQGRNWTPYILWGVFQAEIILVVILNVLEVI